MIHDEATHRARRVGGPTARRVATPRVEPRRRDRRAVRARHPHRQRRGGSPGVRPRTRGSCPTIPAARGRGFAAAGGGNPLAPKLTESPVYQTHGHRSRRIAVDPHRGTSADTRHRPGRNRSCPARTYAAAPDSPTRRNRGWANPIPRRSAPQRRRHAVTPPSMEIVEPSLPSSNPPPANTSISPRKGGVSSFGGCASADAHTRNAMLIATNTRPWGRHTLETTHRFHHSHGPSGNSHESTIACRVRVSEGREAGTSWTLRPRNARLGRGGHRAGPEVRRPTSTSSPRPSGAARFPYPCNLPYNGPWVPASRLLRHAGGCASSPHRTIPDLLRPTTAV